MMTYVLWIVQALLALLFLFAGGTKLVIPPDVLASMGSPNQIPLPGWFVRVLGVAPAAGRCRAGRHHDRRDGADDGGRRGRGRSGSAGCGAARGLRRLRPLAAGGAPRAGGG